MSSPKRKDARRLKLVAPGKRKHSGEIIELFSKVFSEPAGYFAMRDFGRNNLFYGPYDWEASRIGLLDGRIVTHWGVWGFTMRIGRARVRVGGVGCVATHADYWKRGLMAETGWASINAMHDAGYDTTMLFGIDDFYGRFGYVNAWPGVSYTVKISDLPSKRPRVSPREFAVRHRDDIAELYNREYAQRTGTAVRPNFLRFPKMHKWQGHVWSDARRRPSGYVITGRHRDALVCVEYAGDVEQALRILAGLARRCKCKEVGFPRLHYDSPLCKRIRQGNCRVETNLKRNGGPMIRTLNLQSTLGKLIQELSRRLRKSHMASWRGNLLIADPREKVTLAINRSDVRIGAASTSKHSVRGGEQVAQLILGSNDPGEIVEAAGIKVTGDARKLIEALFPNQHPRLCALDEY